MPKKYHLSMRAIHWIMALIILELIAVGWYMHGLDSSVSYKMTLYSLHKSFGVTIIFLFMLRVIFRVFTKTPPLPETIPPIVRKFAISLHHLMYIVMIAVPVSGYAMSNMYGYNVELFGISLPKIFPKNSHIADVVHELHEIFAYTLLAMIVLHVAGVIKHHFFDKNPENDVIKRMV